MSATVDTGGAMQSGGYWTWMNGPGEASCAGANTATFTWHPAIGETLISDPPPAAVIIKESATFPGLATAEAMTRTSVRMSRRPQW